MLSSWGQLRTSDAQVAARGVEEADGAAEETEVDEATELVDEEAIEVMEGATTGEGL